MAQDSPYPPTQQQYPPPQQQQYPQPQQQYPPAPQQYPPQQQPYPPQQQPYPQGQYPQQQYPPQQGQYGPPPQYGYAPPPMLSPQQLAGLVQRVALYPDPLLVQILTASTYYQEIPEAAGWAQEHAGLHGDQLAQAIQADNVPWDPSVVALLPFPQVLDMMARDPGWTQALGNAVLAERPQVMDAIQQLRSEAEQYGYLRTGPNVQVVNEGPGDIEIVPVNPGLVVVPYYNPAVVFYAPRPGFFVGGAIGWGPGIFIGASFSPWGWGHPGFAWRSHEIMIDAHPFGRTWVNRGAYVHPYNRPFVRPAAPRVESHSFHESREHERR